MYTCTRVTNTVRTFLMRSVQSFSAHSTRLQPRRPLHSFASVGNSFGVGYWKSPQRNITVQFGGAKENGETSTPEFKQSLDGLYGEDEEVDRRSLISVELFMPGELAASFADCVMGEGALSCSVDDANKGTKDEQEMFLVGSLAGENAFYYRDPSGWQGSQQGLWDASRVTLLFSDDADVAACVNATAAILGVPPPAFQVRGVVNQDWVETVRDSYIATEVAEGMWIVPSWLDPPKPDAINVLLEPGMAFGTGEHPTTRLCMQWMQRSIQECQTVLDYGAGSGILALGALHLGAKLADGTDTDPLAVEAAVTNAELNNMEDKFFCCECDPNGLIHNEGVALRVDNAFYDVLIANILLPPLLELEEKFAMAVKPNGKLCLSGLLVEQAPRVIELYEKHFDNLTVDSDEQGLWACVHGTRRSEN